MSSSKIQKKLYLLPLSALALFAAVTACGGEGTDADAKDDVGDGDGDGDGDGVGTGGVTGSGGFPGSGGYVGVGGTTGAANICDTATPELTDTFPVTEHFFASGRWGNYMEIGDPEGGCNGDRAPGPNTGECLAYSYTPGTMGDAWAGITFQNTNQNWGDDPGICIGPGATKLSFWAKTEDGGETVKFDTVGDATTGDVVMTTDWTHYEIDIPAGYNDNSSVGGVAGAFTWGGARPAATMIIYIDNIEWIFEGGGLGGAGNE